MFFKQFTAAFVCFICYGKIKFHCEQLTLFTYCEHSVLDFYQYIFALAHAVLKEKIEIMFMHHAAVYSVINVSIQKVQTSTKSLRGNRTFQREVLY